MSAQLAPSPTLTNEPSAEEKLERLTNSVRAFLGGLDRGFFDWDGQIGPSYDRAESAFVTGLRQDLAFAEGRS